MIPTSAESLIPSGNSTSFLYSICFTLQWLFQTFSAVVGGRYVSPKTCYNPSPASPPHPRTPSIPFKEVRKAKHSLFLAFSCICVTQFWPDVSRNLLGDSWATSCLNKKMMHGVEATSYIMTLRERPKDLPEFCPLYH